VAVYAVVSVIQAQTAWSYPFSGGANFGLLPNRNHTATLLVVGSVISFGLMQWEVSHGYRLGAASAALCGAPALAALLFFSTSRAGVLFLGLGFLLWVAGATGTAVKQRTSGVAAGILAAFLLVLFFAGGNAVRDRLGQLWNDVMATEAGLAGAEREIDFRQPIFRDTLTMIGDAPLTGQGLGHFEFVFPHYREASRREARVLHPESDWLMVAAESGIPAVIALVVLAGWYFARCWRTRRDSGGLLRWTVASAIGGAVAHAVIDVPWHRPGLGWFLLVVALAAVPSGGTALRHPRIWRGLQMAVGLAILGGGLYFAWAGTTPRPPLPYRWEAFERELKELGEARKHDDGEFVAREAVGDFPLHYQAYYWRAAFLRVFEGTDDEIKSDLAAGRFVEPVLPVAAAEQAQIWASIDPEREAEARFEAMRRGAFIDESSGGQGQAVVEMERGLRAAQERPATQVELRKLLEADSPLLAHWVRLANADLADGFLVRLGSEAEAWLDALAPGLRSQVLNRWVTLPSAAAAVQYMERRGGARVYGQPLANFYAKEGDKERAVRIVAEAEAVDLGTGAGWGSGDWGRQLSDLQAQKNDVAVRRLLREAVEAKAPDPERLSVSLAWYAAAGDWESAWKAASRLATLSKKGQ
jgi:hypothetical protein